MPAQGPVLFIDAEDGEKVIHRRLAAITAHYDVWFDDLIKGGLHLISWFGQDAVLATANRKGKVEPTARYGQILEAVRDIKPVMIGIASSANVYAGSEIERAQVQQFVGLMTRLAIAANGSLVLISHPSLTGIASGSGISGSTQWHNAVRARFLIQGIKPEKDALDDDDAQPDSDLREIVFKKNQYGPVEESITLRYQDGLFLPLGGTFSFGQAAQEARAGEVFLAVLRRYAAENRNASDRPGKSYAPALFAKESEAKKAGVTKKQLEAAMRRLFEAGKIWNEDIGKPSRPQYRLAVRGWDAPENV